MKHEVISAERKVFDHVILGVTNKNEFRCHVIESASPPMHEQMTNQVRHVTSMWKRPFTSAQRFLVLHHHQEP